MPGFLGRVAIYLGWVMAASFRGVACFGLGVTSAPARDPSRAWVQAVFGSDGLALLPGGSSGLWVFFRGRLVVPSGFEALRSLDDGQGGELVDTLGVVYPLAVLDQWSPSGRTATTAAGVVLQAYWARFLVPSG